MQGLYEAKLLSYPRTDTPFITENEFAYLKANFGKYSGFLGLDLEKQQHPNFDELVKLYEKDVVKHATSYSNQLVKLN